VAIRVVLAGDNLLVREGVRQLLEADPVTTTARFAPEVDAGVYFRCLEALPPSLRFPTEH
jgi:hypothetical protein